MPKLSDYVLSTAREVQLAKPTGQRTEFRIKGARNLVLRVACGGTKTWAFHYCSPSSRRWRKLSLGSYPTVDLAQAKDRALALTVAVLAGKDPLATRDADTSGSFRSLVERFMTEHQNKNAVAGKKSSWTEEVERVLDADILPTLGHHDPVAISRADIVKIIEKVADRGSYVAADRVLAITRTIFNWANGTGRLEVNPTLGLKKRRTSKPRDRVLSDREITILWCALDEVLSPDIRDALRLQLLLGLRVGEALGAAKAEIDFARQVWTIPAIRTKSRREHRLPLSLMALTILRAAMERAGSSEWVFPSPIDGKPVRPKSASRALLRLRRRLGIGGIRTHDLRRTLATRLGEMGVPDEVIARVLNHAPTTVTTRVYNHAHRFDAMKQALDQWSERLGELVRGGSGEVVTHPRAAEPSAAQQTPSTHPLRLEALGERYRATADVPPPRR